MGIYNFQERFVSRILAGSKRHTIRAFRKYPDTAGSVLHLYTGLRHKGAELIARVQCTAVDEITIDQGGAIALSGQPLSGEECEALARMDGFDDLASMLAFWAAAGRLPFRGQILFWAPIAPAPTRKPRREPTNAPQT